MKWEQESEGDPVRDGEHAAVLAARNVVFQFPEGSIVQLETYGHTGGGAPNNAILNVKELKPGGAPNNAILNMKELKLL